MAERLNAAEKSLMDALPEEKKAVKRAGLYYTAALVQCRVNDIENEKIYLKRAYDTVLFYNSIYKTYTYLRQCDSVEATAEAGGRFKYRPVARKLLLGHRANLLNGGRFFLRKKDYKEAYRFLDLYLASAEYPMFAHDFLAQEDTMYARVAYWIITAGYRIGEYGGVARYASAALRYGKNQKREDVKSHHYIISFDPRDGPDNGLTVDRAQELGEKFCAEHFPGHQALVCTHPDGHSHTENIHVHIVINSLRIAEVPMLPHMDRPADRKAGCKHRCTDAAMNYLKAEVMEMCHSEGLYQIDLLNGSKERITEREYWAQKKGQAALDRANAPIAADGIAPRQTKFETDKAKLRRTIREALAAASGFDEFAALLLRHGVTVKESRGRLSYLTPDRTKPITARKLGDDFDRAAVLSVLEQNAARAAEKPAAIAEYPGSIKDRLRTKKEAKNAPNNDAVQRMVDIAAKRAEGKGRGYEKWATMHNLKQMSATLMLYQQYGFSSPDELDAAISAANTATQESLAGLKGLEAAIREKKELQRNLLGYIGTKPARDGLKAQKSEKARRAYREQHESDFIIADTAARYFREHGITKLPASKALQREIEQLTVQKNAGYNDYREKRQRAQELQTVRRNIDQILRGAPSQQKKREQER